MAEERCNLFWSKEFILDNNKEIKEVIEKEIPPIPGVGRAWGSNLQNSIKHKEVSSIKKLPPRSKRCPLGKALWVGGI
jgi:hypothetical protein